MSEKMNRLKPIRFPLAIIAVNDIGAFTTIDLTLQVSEILNPDRSKEHVRILTHAIV